MKRKGLIVATAIFYTLTFFSYSALADTIHVPSELYPTIQDGIDAAFDEDLVLVEPGTYTENIDFLGKSITVQSEEGADTTIIDGGECTLGVFNCSVVTFNTNETIDSVITGFTITNGNGTDHHIHGSGLSGGGIFCANASATIENCVIIENSVDNDGGGILLQQAGSSIVRNCTISRNSCHYNDGGGISIYKGSPFIENCIISENCIEDGPWSMGAGIHCEEGSPTITNCTIVGNTILNGYSGGGVGFLALGPSSPILKHCTITGNRVYRDADASEVGGGLMCKGTNLTAEVVNCIFWDNYAEGGGNELAVINESYPGTLTVSYSDVQSGEAGVYVDTGCTLNWLDGNIDADPLFVAEGYWDDNGTPEDHLDDIWNDGDYHLKGGSPCIDVGTDAGILVDIEGDDRPYGPDGPEGDDYDMGSDEYGMLVAYIRHRLDDIQVMHIYKAPMEIDPWQEPNPAPTLKASDTWVGKVGTDYEISHMAAGDTDGDGVDEMIVIRLKESGRQVLNIHEMPTVVDGDMNPCIATDSSVGTVLTDDEITHIAAGDTDGDGVDELIFIRHRINESQYLNIYNAPTEVDGDINPLIASDIWIGKVGTDNEITHMAAGDTDERFEFDELIFIRQRSYTNNNQYLNIYEALNEVGGDMNPIIASDPWIGNIGTRSEIMFMAAGNTDGIDANVELVFVRNRQNNQQYLNIYDAPIVVDGDMNPLLASDLWIGNIGTSNEVTHLAMIQCLTEFDGYPQ